MKGFSAVLLNLWKSCSFNRFIHISPVSVSIRLEMFLNIVPYVGPKRVGMRRQLIVLNNIVVFFSY